MTTEELASLVNLLQIANQGTETTAEQADATQLNNENKTATLPGATDTPPAPPAAPQVNADTPAEKPGEAKPETGSAEAPKVEQVGQTSELDGLGIDTGTQVKLLTALAVKPDIDIAKALDSVSLLRKLKANDLQGFLAAAPTKQVNNVTIGNTTGQTQKSSGQLFASLFGRN